METKKLKVEQLIKEKKYFEAIEVLYEILESDAKCDFAYVNLVRCFSEDYSLEKTYLINTLINEAKSLNITDEAYLNYVNSNKVSTQNKQAIKKAKEVEKKIEKLAKKPHNDKWYNEVKELFESVQADYENDLEYTKEIKNKEELDKMYDEYFNKYIDPYITYQNMKH